MNSVSCYSASIGQSAYMVDNAQHWSCLSFRFLTPHIVKETASLRENHDVHFEGMSKSNDLQVVTIDACLGHCFHVLFVGSVHFFGSWSSGHGRRGQRAMVLSFWISTRATSGVDDKERLKAVGVVCHVFNRGITYLGITGLVSVQLVRKGIE